MALTGSITRLKPYTRITSVRLYPERFRSLAMARKYGAAIITTNTLSSRLRYG